MYGEKLRFLRFLKDKKILNSFSFIMDTLRKAAISKIYALGMVE